MEVEVKLVVYAGPSRSATSSETQKYSYGYQQLLENVEHCGGEPEQADRILMSDVTYSTFGVQCKLTQWNPH